MTLEGYQSDIDIIKAKIIEQKVPTKYAKGLATLCVLNCAYEGGDAIAGFILDGAMRSDPELISEFEDEAGIKHGAGLDRFRISRIRDAFGKNYQVFRALNVAGVNMDLEWSLKEVK